jgi:hypothetical protein
MSPALITALLALLEMAVKEAPHIVADVDALLHPKPGALDEPIAPKVEEEMSTLYKDLNP